MVRTSTGLYRKAGGRRLGPDAVSAMILGLFDHMLTLGRDPARYDDYPTVAECLNVLPATAGLAAEEKALIEEVFFRHETGTIPDSHARAVAELARTHRLGLVSNVWSRSAPFARVLEERGLLGLFDVAVFSSDVGAIKPSARIFEAALSAFDAERGRVLMVGDNHKRDVAGAKALGLRAVLIAPGSPPLDGSYAAPDLVVESLTDLLNATG